MGQVRAHSSICKPQGAVLFSFQDMSTKFEKGHSINELLSSLDFGIVMIPAESDA